jgi:hypothetical protein
MPNEVWADAGLGEEIVNFKGLAKRKYVEAFGKSVGPGIAFLDHVEYGA